MDHTETTGERPEAELIGALDQANFHPVWDRFRDITPAAPNAHDTSCTWRWQVVEPLTRKAVNEVPMEHAERRAMIMYNPDFGGATLTTNNMIAAYTMLKPGDRAPMHRHTFAAIRYATRCEGALTIVNGRRCEMHEGDLVLTPGMCWHGHINEGDNDTVWFDAADMPLIAGWDANFFEPGEEGNTKEDKIWQVDEGDEKVWAGGGLSPMDYKYEAPHSPKYRYAGDVTKTTLDEMEPGPGGIKILRYTNPMTGGAVMRTLDLYKMRLTSSENSSPRRATYNVICLVTEGQGSSTVGDKTFEWSKNDVFTVPHWTWASHKAISGDAELFLVTDRAAQENLGFVRVENQK